MCSLQNLSEEYLCDALRLEQRIALLESQASRTISLEVRRKLRRRINALYTMACESRQTAFLLEHYYDKPKEAVFYVPCSTQSHRSGKRFSRHGYGAASPALIMAETLTRHQYQVCVLNLLEGMTQKEIAEIFGISPSAVSRSISSGQRRLRKALGYHFEQADPMEDFWEEQPYL